MPSMFRHIGTLLLAVLQPLTVESKGFLVERSNVSKSLDSAALHGDLQSAIGAVLGCGGLVDPARPLEVQRELLPIWQTLPKNANGRIERRSLRYLTHRHFMQQSALLIRGFEPTRVVNESHWAVADILSGRVPGYLESILVSRHSTEQGFSLEDAAHMVTMLEQLVGDSERTLLEVAYGNQRRPTRSTLSRAELTRLLEVYMVHWMMGDDKAGISVLLANRTLLETAFPHWHAIAHFLQGQVRALEFRRQQSAGSPRGRRALETRFSFDDVHKVASTVTASFASFWDSECASMKSSLVEMDTQQTGRVPLSKFYGAALGSEWRFGESESYLRELGALDETSPWKGKQVIIANYIQAASNCIVATPHYLVCCLNPCDGLLSEIESAVAAPVAAPDHLLEIVGNMTVQKTLEDDESPQLAGALAQQLESIAEVHGGKVPIHGRLFAQWLHYAFPHECPFPHKLGTVAAVSPNEFGGDYIASDEEMEKHAYNETQTDIAVDASMEEMHWMSQWSHEEELIADYSAEMHAPWKSRRWLGLAGVALLAAAVVFGVVSLSSKTDHEKSHTMFKSHMV